MKKLFILDTGAYDNHPIYETISSLEGIAVTVCGATETRSELKRVESEADRLNVPLHAVDDLDTLLEQEQTFPDRILIITRPTAAKDFVIQLLRRLSSSPCISEHLIKIMICHPPGVATLSEMLELLAYSRIHKIPIWVGASRRYASGMHLLYNRIRRIGPLTQINGSIHSGIYGADGLFELINEVLWHYADLVCYIAARGEHSEIPVSLSAEHSSSYRDAISVSFSFDSSLIGCLSVSANHKGTLDFDESLSVTGVFNSLQLARSLNGLQYLRQISVDEGYQIGGYNRDTDEFMNLTENLPEYIGFQTAANEPEIPDDSSLISLQNFASPCEEDDVDSWGALKVGFGETLLEEDAENPDRLRFMLQDFMASTNEHSVFDSLRAPSTLRSCLPAMWMCDAIERSIHTKARIERPEFDLKLEKEVAGIKSPSNPVVYQTRSLACARAGFLDRAVDICLQGIIQTDTWLIRNGCYTPRSLKFRSDCGASGSGPIAAHLNTPSLDEKAPALMFPHDSVWEYQAQQALHKENTSLNLKVNRNN